MKKETASQKRYDRLHKLISACCEHFSQSEMIECFNEITDTEWVEKQDAEDSISDLALAGYCIFYPDSTSKADKLKEYAETNIFPYYNEQQTAILF